MDPIPSSSVALGPVCKWETGHSPGDPWAGSPHEEQNRSLRPGGHSRFRDFTCVSCCSTEAEMATAIS
ncbi:hypothetical protein GN956_G3765 [Arapaima gigas]